MRAAVRGDLERAQARRDADPWRAPEPRARTDPVSESGGLRASGARGRSREPSSLLRLSRSLRPSPCGGRAGAGAEPEPPTPPESEHQARLPLAAVPLGVLGVDPGRLERGVEVREVLHPDDPPVADRHDRGVALDAELAPRLERPVVVGVAASPVRRGTRRRPGRPRRRSARARRGTAPGSARRRRRGRPRCRRTTAAPRRAGTTRSSGSSSSAIASKSPSMNAR